MYHCSGLKARFNVDDYDKIFIGLIKKRVIMNGGKTSGSFFVQTDMKKLPDFEMVKIKVMDWIGKNNLEKVIK